MLKKKKNSYFLRFLFLKQNILKKRNYIYNYNIEKFDLLFDTYRDAIIKNLLKISELNRYSLKFFLRKKKFRVRFFLKLLKKGIAKIIKNEILLLAPDLLFLHKKAKSWKILKNKKKRRLKNIKKIVLHYFPNYRESYVLKEQLDKTYFWLVNTTKRQILNTIKFNNLKKKSNIIDNYYRIKFSFFKKKLFFLKNKKKTLFLFFKKKKISLYDVFQKFFW